MLEHHKLSYSSFDISSFLHFYDIWHRGYNILIFVTIYIEGFVVQVGENQGGLIHPVDPMGHK